MLKSNRKGFSLIELLIVLAILFVIAAIAIPNFLASRRVANEASAQSSLRTIHYAQSTYQATWGNGAFAPDLATLGRESLIDGYLANGSKDGYNFEMYDVQGVAGSSQFSASAYPIKSSGILQTGLRRFGITEIGVMRGDKDLSAMPHTRGIVNSMRAIGY